MPAPPKRIDKRFATVLMIADELAILPPHLRIRLEAVWFLYGNDSTQEVAETLEVSRRSVQRWLATWNKFGPNALLARTKRGPKRKISREAFYAKLHPLIVGANGEVMPTWSIADVQRRLAQSNEIQVSRATLRLAFRRFGYRPRRPTRRPAPEPIVGTTSNWEHPWRSEYGNCLADFLQNTDQPPHPVER